MLFRSKLPRDQARNITAPSNEGVSHPLPAVTSTAADVVFQTEGQLEAEYTSDTTNLASTVEDEVAVAASALNLEKESYFDEGIYSESEDSGEEDAMHF